MAGVSRGHTSGVFFSRKARTRSGKSMSSSSRDDRGRQKPSDRGTDAFPKQVKPVGGERSVEASPARDEGKSDVGVWKAIFERENMQTALKRVESNKGA